MSSRRKFRPEQKETNITFNLTSNDGAFGDSIDKDLSKQVEEDDCDEPMVFLCGKCKLPVGDSLSWAGSEETHNQILLKRISNNVLMGKETHFYGTRKDSGCLVVHLTCQGCNSLLGVVYTSTPRELDYKRSLFCLNVASIDSYVLGSPNNQVAAVDPQELPVTLEFKHSIEQQLAEIKMLTVTLGQQLLEIETELQSKSSDIGK